MADPTPHHRLSVHRQVGPLHLAVDLTLAAEWTLLYGPSGSGKTSILRAVSGLLPSAFVEFARRNPAGSADDWQTLQNTRRSAPTHLRQLAWAPQQTSLFPHLTVRENVAFSQRFAAGPRSPSERDFYDALLESATTLFRLQPLLNRVPDTLSGGERQRVNLARAFAHPDCRLLLLDEPFNGIDRSLCNEILPELRATLRTRNIPVLSVSHDVEEAFRLQCEVVKIHNGKIEAQGPVAEVLAQERDETLKALSEKEK